MKTKRCPKCGGIKPLRQFSRNRSRKSGLADWCKECVATYNREYREANREKVAACKRKWQRTNPEKVAARGRKYRKANPEKDAARKRKYREGHKEEGATYQREWRKDNPEKARAKDKRDARKRRARKAGAEGSYTTAEFKGIVEFYAPYARPNGCLWPDDGTECRGVITPDHVVPLSKGGSNDISNIQPLCHGHNSMKGVKTIDFRH